MEGRPVPETSGKETSLGSVGGVTKGNKSSPTSVGKEQIYKTTNRYYSLRWSLEKIFLKFICSFI